MSVTGFNRRRRMIAARKAKAEAKAELIVKAEEQKPIEPTNKELMSMLDELGVKYDKRANKATLKALLEQVNNGGAE